MSNPKSGAKRLTLPDIVVVLICLGGAFFGIFTFWQDLNKTLAKLSETPVGIISYKYNGVQRRFANRLIWSQLQTESPVYNGDIIRTADLSDATIHFLNENSIEIAENCLIQVFYGSEGARIELSRGAVTAATKSEGLVIASGSKEIAVNAESLVITSSAGTGPSDPEQDVNIQVISGTLSLNSAFPSGDQSPSGVQIMEAGSALSASSGGRIETPPRVVVLSPLPDTVIDAKSPRQQIQFSWRKNNFSADERVRLEIAADRHFAKMAESLDASGDGESLSLLPGTWWWRAYPLSQAQDAGTVVGKLTITPPPVTEAPVVQVPAAPAAPVRPARAPAPAVPLPAPKNLRPASGFVVDVEEVRKNRSIIFSWDAVPGASAYVFTLYKETASGTPILTARNAAARHTIDISALDNGNFLWRVEAVSGSRRSQGAESRLTIDIPLPAKPRLGVSGTIQSD